MELTEWEEAEEEGLGDEVDGVAGAGEVQPLVSLVVAQLSLDRSRYVEIDRLDRLDRQIEI